LLPSQEFHALPTPWERADSIPMEHAIVTGKELAGKIPDLELDVKTYFMQDCLVAYL
jgi:hypothetical protein